MTSKTLAQTISHLHPCREARAWLGDKTAAAEAWESCPRGDWTLWLAARVGVDRRLVVLAACDCARTALRHVPAGEDRPRLAIEAAEAWAAEPTEEKRAAAAAAAAAAYDARVAYAYAAADADAHAHAYAYAARDAYDATLKKCAALVRARIPAELIAESLRLL